ncbi:MAG: hypothetical protein JNL74_00360 [Fibrobacteres bacterium]|nr:hypothetical protein [Fibrobacterota bacterium]
MAIIYAGTPVSNSEIETDEPFELAVLLESLKKAVQKYNIAAVADIGSKGIVCAALRLASHSNVGIEIDADSLPISHDGVTLNDILLSQKRNRLLLAVDNNIADEIVEHFESMGIKASVAGVVNSTSMLTLNKNRGCAADIPVKSLLSGGVVKTVAIARERPKWIGVDDQFDQLSIPEPHALSQPMNYNTALIRLLESEIIGSKEFIYCRFDSRMGSINATPPGFNAALVNIGDERGAALSFSSASEYVHHDPRNSGKIAAARALRNVVCAGAKPVALLTLLTHEDSANNYGAVAAIEFEEGVAELVNEFTILKAVSVGGHNSVGAVGVVDNLRAAVTPFFKNEGDCIFLLGETRDEIGASAYLKIVHGTGSGKPPVLNIKREYSNQAAVYEAVQKGLIRSAHSCTMGGLACTLAECCVLNINQLLGAAINYDCGLRADRLLFSESESRTVLTVRPENAKAFTEHLLHRHVHFEEIGVVGGDSLIINSDINIDILTLAEAYKTKGLQS